MVDDSVIEDRERAILRHIYEHWPRNHIEIFSWSHGPLAERIGKFKVCRISPLEEGEPWVYVSMGASSVVSSGREKLELVILSPEETPIHIETLAAAVFFHIKYPMFVGKILDIGRAWIDGSTMHQFLVSLPYPYGPRFEYLEHNGETIRFLWLLPINPEEATFAMDYGVDALENKFDDAEINAVDPLRKSVV